MFTALTTLLLLSTSIASSAPVGPALDLTQFVHSGDYQSAQAAAEVHLPNDVSKKNEIMVEHFRSTPKAH